MGNTHGVVTRTIEFATRARKISWTSDKCYMQQKGFVPSQRSLSCELQYKLSVLLSKFPSPCNFNCCSI